MTGNSSLPLHWHEDPALFSEATNFTASQTGFAARLIEKDYFCSLILALLATAGPNPLVFKGGTCLSKVYAGFYRLSEDLDFAVPLETDSSRGERRRQGILLKETVAAMLARAPCFLQAEPLSGQNESRQYLGSVTYRSLLNNQDETIRIEISLREPLLLPVYNGLPQTLLRHPVSGRPAETVPIPCLAQLEAWAEKFRATLSRPDVAVRDFFDIDFAHRKQLLPLNDPQFLDFVRRKLAVPGNAPVTINPECLTILRRQREARLKPVLRAQDYREFDLDRAFAIVTEMARRLEQA
ncbi:MAG: nucleotidyl transferase AbiEii/AbiGii toxin family protein [bacterium]